MPRRSPADEPEQPDPVVAPDPAVPVPEPGVAGPAVPSLADLGIAGISRRRVAWVALAVLAGWIVIGFAGQAAEGAAAAQRVAHEEAAAARTAADTEALRRELALVGQERWYLQEARAYQLGSRKERPFALAPDAPPLPDDAPGSAARRVGAETVERSPLEAWLEVLFGPAPGS